MDFAPHPNSFPSMERYALARAKEFPTNRIYAAWLDEVLKMKAAAQAGTVAPLSPARLKAAVLA